MEIKDFLNTMLAEHKTITEKLIPIIEKYEKNLELSVSSTMGKEMLVYKEQDEFKYAIASHPKHLSFHNMVMYVYPDLHKKYEKLFEKSNFRKGCINFLNIENISLDLFKNFIKESASYVYPTELQLKKQKK